jgi:benzoyl-CoA reductase subunit B
MVQADYETRPISEKVWGMIKKERREHFWRTFSAQKEGGIVATGMAPAFQPVLAGFGTVGTPSIGTAFTRVSREGTAADGLRKFVEITAAKGYGPICGALGAHLGQVFAGVSFKNPSTGEEIKPDFVYLTADCRSIMKVSQMAADFLGLPLLFIDPPPGFSFTENRREYMVSQLLDAIEWIQKRTGKTFDDERFLHCVRFNVRTNVLWAKICDLTRNIPSPVSGRMIPSLHTPLVATAYSQGTMEYLEALYDEMQQRIKDGISGAPFERKRLVHSGIHPMYRPDILRWPDEYGAAFIISFGNRAGAYTEDGQYVLPKTLEERGIELKTREDGLRILLDPFGFRSLENSRETMRRNYIRRLKDWHIDGVMQHLARRCSQQVGALDQNRDCEEAGIIVGTYEASEGDPNEWNESRVREDYASFFERLGLTKLN